MKRLHIVSDRNPCNGMFVAARMMAEHEEGSRVVTCAEFLTADFADYEEVVVHGCWLPCYWRCCWKVLRLRQAQPLLSRMTHANLDPVRIKYHGWKKRLVAPIERWLFRRCDKILVTCEAEREWVREYIKPCRNVERVEVVDLKRFFKLNHGLTRIGTDWRVREDRTLHVLYLGRRHPLKGVEYLERAVKEISGVNLRIVSDHHGEELARDWVWCDVLCLPTLSENFGLVVAEALERGKRVITTDGAPAWGDFEPCRGGERVEGFVYLRGFREGTEEKRVALLKDAIKQFVD